MLSAAVAVVLIRVSKCKEIHYEQIGCLGSLERATTVFNVTPSLENKVLTQKSKIIKFEIFCAVLILYFLVPSLVTSEKTELQTYTQTDYRIPSAHTHRGLNMEGDNVMPSSALITFISQSEALKCGFIMMS